MVDPPPPELTQQPAPVRAPGRRSWRRRLVAAAGIAVFLVADLAVLAVVTGRAPLGSKPPARVALIDPQGALEILDADGGHPVVHRATGTTFAFPAWSPDGSRVGAVAQHSSGGGAAIEVFGSVSDPNARGTVLYDSTTSVPFYLYWRPDGGRVAFLSQESQTIALQVAPSDASSPATMLRKAAPMYWAWEGGDRLLVHAGGNEGQLFLGEVAGDGATVATVTDPPGDFRVPAASADGRYEAYATKHGDGTAAIVVTGPGGSPRHEVPVSGPAAFSFAPSGDLLAFVGPGPSDRQVGLPLGALQVLDAAVGQPRTLLTGEVVSFFWAPDGRTIATLSVAGTSGPGAADVPDAAGLVDARLASTRSGGAPPDLPPGATGIGVTLAFVDVASGAVRSQQTIQLSNLFINSVLPYFDQYALSHRLWSPDSASLLLPIVAQDGTEQLEVLPADGSASRVLASGSMGSWSP